MAFNLGAFAGGLAKGGMDTYQTLEAIESQKKRDALVELQTKEAEQAMKGREALRSAIAEQGDMNTVNPAQMMAGPAPQGLPQEGGYMTPEVAASEKLARVRQRALEGGADPTAVMQYANAQRADTSAFNTDKAFEWMRKSDQTVADKGLRAAAEEYLLPHYNSNKGTMNDGLTAKIVDTKNGPVVQFSDSKGNVQNDRTRPLTMDNFRAARDEVGASMLAAAGPEHFYKAREYGLKSREVAAKEGELGVHKEFYGKGGTYERAAGMRAGGGDKSIKARAGEYAEALVDAGAVNPATKKPYTTQEAKQYALSVALKDPNAKTKAEWTMSTDGQFRSNAAGVVQDFDQKTNQWKTRGLPQVSANANKAGVIADVSPSGQVGYKGKDGWYSSEQEAVESLSAPSGGATPAVTPALPMGSRTELRLAADKIDSEIASLRKGVTVRTPSDQRAAIGKQIDDLQVQRSATLKAWAKTPGVANDSGAAFPMPRP